MKRLLLLNVTLAPPTQASGPKLLPLGMFSPAPTNLSMMDVRMAVNSTVFQQYLTFFSKHLRDVRTKDDGGIGMHTVRISAAVASTAQHSTKLIACHLKFGRVYFPPAVHGQGRCL